MAETQVLPVQENKAEPQVKELYKAIEGKMHMLPNIFKNMGNSAVALKGFLDLNEAAGMTSLSPQLREKIALAVGQANSCQYCLSAHTMLAKVNGIPEMEIMQARKGMATSPKEKAILSFVKSVVDKKAHIDKNELTSLKSAGVSDKEIVEIILVVMVNMFTNYFNLVTGTQVDFPAAPSLQ